MSQFREGGSGNVALTVAVAVVKLNISFLFGFALTLAVAGENLCTSHVAELG